MTNEPVIIAEFAGTQVPTKSRIEHYTQKEILVKSAKAFGVCWLTALVVAFVPVIHFVISPIALIAGPFAAVFVYYKVRKLPRKVEGQVACNHCHAETDFFFVNVPPPFYEMCKHCRTGYEILWPPKTAP
ncbi:MAG: hypothetical protein EOP10_32505 [Proteobacteria bacterium]|nr:MAG: hypothetical protein EOP10_32505 [Pseudomonadota bacterium]